MEAPDTSSMSFFMSPMPQYANASLAQHPAHIAIDYRLLSSRLRPTYQYCSAFCIETRTTTAFAEFPCSTTNFQAPVTNICFNKFNNLRLANNFNFGSCLHNFDRDTTTIDINCGEIFETRRCSTISSVPLSRAVALLRTLIRQTR